MKRKAKRKPSLVPKPDTRSKVSKRPLKDVEHRQRVNGLPCCVCDAPPPSEAHHIREAFPRTMGRRIGDNHVVPLCRMCHLTLHKHSREYWAPSDEPVPIAAALYAETLALRASQGTAGTP